MNVSYVVPLRSAWSRMLRMLFRPFQIEVWLVLGFGAFLSEYLSWGFPGSRFGFRPHHRAFPHEALRRAVDFLRNPFGMMLVLWIVVAALALFLLFMWISSRGKFIFLDNVARERSGIVEPWRRLKRLGNSLFRWRLAFGILCLLVFGAILLPFLASLAAIVREETFAPANLLVLLPLAMMFLPLGIVTAYVLLFLTSFVVPIMYRHDLTATAAWGRFLGLLRQEPLSFIFYGLFVLVLATGVGAAVFAVGMGTCCIGFILLGVPYVGSVLMLPLEVTARALGPEFLAQFGPDFSVVAAPSPAPPAVSPAPPSPPAGGDGA